MINDSNYYISKSIKSMDMQQNPKVSTSKKIPAKIDN